MSQNQKNHLLLQNDESQLININLISLDYFTYYQQMDHLYLFERDKILKKYKLTRKQFCLNNYFGFSKNWKYFYYMDCDNGILYLIELESKKEINIQRKSNYETIMLNNFVIFQWNSSLIEFMNIQTKKIIKFSQGDNDILYIQDISQSNQYFIVQNYRFVLLVQHNTNKIEILYRYNLLVNNYEFSKNIFLSEQIFLNLYSDISYIRQYHRHVELKLIRKFKLKSYDYNQVHFGRGQQNIIQFIVSSYLHQKDYLIEVNLNNATQNQIQLKTQSDVLSDFILIDKIKSKQLKQNFKAISQISGLQMIDMIFKKNIKQLR